MSKEHSTDAQDNSTLTRTTRSGRRSDQIRGDLKDLVKNDLIGVEHWKGSKFGAVTGVSLLWKSAGHVSRSVAESSSRLGNLLELITAPESTPEVDLKGSAQQNFDEAMKFYGLSELQVSIALRNTFWSTLLYAAAGLLFVALSFYSLYQWPANGAIESISRLGPIPIIGALLFKHSYTNWIFRKRRIGDGAWIFLRSGDYFPRIK